jgi:dipeptidyl-peptidase-4
MKSSPSILLALTLSATAVAAEDLSVTNQRTQNVADDPAALTLDRIFDSSEFRERGLGEYKWSQRTAAYFTLEAPQAGGKGRDLVRNDAATGHKEIVVLAGAFVPEGQSEPLKVESFEFSADESKLLLYTHSQRVWRRNTRGDYWVLDLASRRLQKLGGKAAPATLMFAKFSPDGTRVAYVRENNLYVQELRRMKITALTKDGSPTLINGTSDWVNEEELSIRDAFRWSPDGRSIAFWQFDTSGVRQFHLINNTADTYPKITSFAYPKVGETNSATRLGLISATGGRVRWLKLPGDPRNHYIPHAEWSPDGKRLLVQQFNRLQSTNRVMLAEAKSGAIRTVLTETDAAWLENENPVRWVDGGSRFLWLSERDGWRHAYSAGTDGQQFARITGGDFDVIQVEAMDEKNGWLYFSASPENPTQHYLHRARLGGGTPERLSPVAQPGWHTYDFAPDGEWAMHTYSTITNPPVVELVQFPGHKVVRVLADNQKLREKLATLKLPTAELLKVDIGDGVSLDACCLKPPGLNPSAKYPLLVHVYGEPASQTVSDRWRGGSGLWHWMLAQQGYIVASIENRGTPVPRGRAWRKMAFRQVGILAAQDQAAGVRELLKLWPYADAGRVGVWGWSGGGSMSLNAIFRYPDLYSTAMAVAPNASQLLYDTIYQERYMGLPQDNAENYRLGSPITHASQLKGNLLLVHGTGDDNGHYQGTERLMNELIAHHKHFTVMPYPNRTHAISEGPNTTRHFYGLLTRYLNEHLPVNPVRVVFETELGAITMETDVARAPISAANFLRYVDGKFYDGGMINRAVRPDNTVRHDVEVQVIQFQADPAREGGMFPPIPMERTSVTGLRNVNGALSMARMGPDTGQASFSIVIGDQPEMDFGGKRNPDGQDFAVFGRVVDGWDAVKKIHQAHTGRTGPYQTETLEPPIKILKAYRKERQSMLNVCDTPTEVSK